VTSRFASIESVGERVYRRLRSDILFGRLAPSQRLKLDVMKDAYGVSISTLREL
jgi:DNA-binding GntR family transcriptional regulator